MPQTCTVIDIRDPDLSLPEYLVFDASMLLDLSTKQDVKQFIASVTQAYRTGSTYPLVCILTLEEYYFKLLKVGYQRDTSLDPSRVEISRKRRKPANRVTWHELYKDRPKAIKSYVPQITAVLQQIRQLPFHIVEPEDLADTQSSSRPIEERMRYYIDEASILPKDALLVAEAERLGVFDIATMDNDFRRLGPEFTIYTAS